MRPLPKKGKVKRYILTCAQNNTGLHEAAWESLATLARFYDAEIMVASFTYGKTARTTAGQKTSREEIEHEEWWEARVVPFLSDRSIELAPGLLWCGELQILPTAVNPLSGMESYTGRASSIIPHVTFAVQSVASPKHQGCKFLYTTGTVTLRNYIQKKAGQKAEFNHGYGGLLVEVCHDGTWFVRQLNADSEGVIYDLDRKASGSRVTTGHRPEALVHGDIHRRQLEPDQRRAGWGADGMVETLRPRRQVLHDVLDFRNQNSHDRKDPHKIYAKFIERGLSVADEVAECADFIGEVSRSWCETIVVPSNHDEQLMRWLKETDFRDDPLNAEFYLAANTATYAAMKRGDKTFYPVEWAMRRAGVKLRRVKFLRRDEDYTVCPDAGGGIELGMHGDVGANGSRGSLPLYARSGRKSITGHSHSAGLRHGAMSVGVTGSLEMGYNIGQSSWSHTHALVYPNGKRTLLTVWKGRWRA